MTLLKNIKLKYKVLLMVVIPMLVMCIVSLVINNTIIKDKFLEDTKKELGATAKSVLAAYDQNSGDYFVNEVGDIWKGSYNVSKSQKFIDNLSQKTGMAVTFFYGDKRIVTSLKDSDGNRIIGTKAGEIVVDNVIKDGNELFTNRVQVEDEMYFGYYVPVFQNNSTDVVGMIFVGLPVKEVNESLDLISRVFLICIVIILIFTTAICYILAGGIAKKIQKSMSVVDQISNGDLSVSIDEKELNRKDEVGELSGSTKSLQTNLSSMIGAISDNTMNLNASSQEMNAMAGQANNAMENIIQNLDAILSGAANQEGNAENIRNNINVIKEMIEKTLAELDNLTASSKAMLAEQMNVKNSFIELNQSNEVVSDTVSDIQRKAYETNESVEKIIRAVSIISDIASQTNLLSLNASIEAARAGELGKGFAVVASEISNLAMQSNNASNEISEMVKVLSTNSNSTVESMNKVQSAIEMQTENVYSTAKILKTVEEHINDVSEGVENIRESTYMLGEQTDNIAKDIELLNDIAKGNKDTASSTLEEGGEVTQLVNTVHNMSVDVSSSANDMAEAVSQFHI